MNDKIALVTGGTSGIGLAIVKQLLDNGCYVFINYGHNEENKYKANSELSSKYLGKYSFIKADVTDETGVINMINEIDNRFGRLDYLVNNAGVYIESYIDEFNSNSFQYVLNVNLTGKMICTKFALRLLRNSNNPSIVNITSRLADKPYEGTSAYSASSAGIISFTKSCALELADDKIRVNSVSPGFTVTPMIINSLTREEIEREKINNLSGRLGLPDDVANAVIFLLSDKADYINGENINVSGGWSLK
jgi:NAD(P)-dependent dehydrogenase (short-subunit alcohol dehydrogenase family)